MTKEPFYTDQAALGEFWFGGMFSVNALCVAMAVQRVGVALLPLQLRRAGTRHESHKSHQDGATCLPARKLLLA